MKTHTNNQSGVTLMLAILVLAAITAIAFSLSTIIFIELRSAGDVVRGEPALYATLGLTEEAMFQYKRFVNGSDSQVPPIFDVATCTWNNAPSTDSEICQIGNVVMNNPKPTLLTEEEVPKVLTVYAGTSISIPMYDVGSFDQKYGRSVLELVPIGNTDKLVYYYEGVPQDPADPPISTAPGYLTEGGGAGQFTNFLNGYQYDLVLTSTSSKNFSISISTYDLDNNTPLGLPYIGKQALDVVANYLGLNRTYRVYIPVP